MHGTGSGIVFYEDGTVARIESIVDGVRHGPVVIWHPNGRLWHSFTLDEQGRHHGCWARYDEDGKLVEERLFTTAGDADTVRLYAASRHIDVTCQIDAVRRFVFVAV